MSRSFRDVRFGVTPLTPFRGGRDDPRYSQGFKLLEGVRGEAGGRSAMSSTDDPAADLAQLAVRHPRIQELDINPFLAVASRDRQTCKALDVPGFGSVPSTVAEASLKISES